MAADLKDLLPDPSSIVYNSDNQRDDHPAKILNDYAEALEQRYPGKIGGSVAESFDAISESSFGIAFYIVAAIGSAGYSYKLLDLSLDPINNYPVKINLYLKDSPGKFKIQPPAKNFKNFMNDVFGDSEFHKIIRNLLNQIEIYEELNSN